MRFTSRKCLYRNQGSRVGGLGRPSSRRSDKDDLAEPVSDTGCFGREGLNTPMSAMGPGCSLTRGVDVKLFVLYLSGSLFSPQ